MTNWSLPSAWKFTQDNKDLGFRLCLSGISTNFGGLDPFLFDSSVDQYDYSGQGPFWLEVCSHTGPPFA
jgi:hypothetical protein